MLQVTLNRLAGYRCSRREDNDAQLFAQSRMLRIRQVDGLNLSTVIATSPLRTVARLLWGGDTARPPEPTSLR